ncbi:fimbrial protein [Pseudomonas sp. RC4D1]|uniref:fimbrial protein n=1 Tax=Pseudomonas sp. RC4D1 TaxID=2834407 RepID=UPI001BD072AD|nr:fimbrial protein [Pseudomonas sp. RC4D1]MBS7560113.1 fimbrial protein [Pseudomonas sp. RC4D1]
MRKNFIALFGAVAVMPFIVANVEAADPITVNGGTIHFAGTVVNAACAVSASSTQMNVVMGQVRVASLDKGIGTQSVSRTPFQITLTDCDTLVSKNASATFNATLDTRITDNTAAKAGIGNGVAYGVGLQIFDITGKPVTFNARTASTALTTQTNQLMFQAGFVSTVSQGEITPGDASTAVNFDVNYF